MSLVAEVAGGVTVLGERVLLSAWARTEEKRPSVTHCGSRLLITYTHTFIMATLSDDTLRKVC